MLAFATASVLAIALPWGAGQDILRLLQDIRADVQARSTNDARRSAVTYWIPQLEDAISIEGGSDESYRARLDLVDLYLVVDRAEDAVRVSDEIIAGAVDPGVVLNGHLRGARAAILAGRDISSVLHYTSEFVARIEAYRFEGVWYPVVFDEKFEEIELVESRYLADSAHWMLFKSANGHDSIDLGIAASILEYAAERIDQYLVRSPQLVPERAASLLYDKGQHYAEAGSLFDRIPDAAAGARLHGLAVEALTQLVFVHGKSSFGQEASTLLLREAHLAGLRSGEYLEFAESVARRLAPGHEILSFLRKEAVELSRDPKTLVASNRIFDLVRRLEEEWFESEHRSHVNYQWSLIGLARNYLELGDVESADGVIELLGDLSLQGSYFTQQFEEVTRVANLYRQRGYGADARWPLEVDTTDDNEGSPALDVELEPAEGHLSNNSIATDISVKAAADSDSSPRDLSFLWIAIFALLAAVSVGAVMLRPRQ